MKKFLPIFALLFLLSACVTSSSGGNARFVTTAVIRGVEVHVSDAKSVVLETLGKPDAYTGNQWIYKGRSKNEPTYILMMSETVDRISVVAPEKTE